MDSLDWSRKYDVVSISRLVLSSLGFTTEQIKLLSDDDMQAMADSLQEELSKGVGGFAEHLRFLVRLYVDERMRRGGTHGKRVESL